MQPIILYLFLFVLLLHKLQRTICFVPPGSNFNPLEIATNCFPHSKDEKPRCDLWISEKSNLSDLQVQCINDTTPSALRIVGEYHIIRINCTASRIIDFQYFGIQPTEAIFIEWTKTVKRNEELGSNQNYSLEVHIYSVMELFNYYNNPNNSVYENKTEGLPLQTIHSYSRSGRFNFFLKRSQDIASSFYLFLEDSAEPSFLRNSETIGVKIVGDKIIVPCTSSHYKHEVILNISNWDVLKPSWDALVGFTITNNLNASGHSDLYKKFTCQLKINNLILDEMILEFNTEKKDVYGMKDFNTTSGDAIEITSESSITAPDYVNYIYPVCRTKNAFEQGFDEKNFRLIVVPSHNYGYLRLVQQFALPKFVTKSYTAKIMQTGWDHATSSFTMPNGFNLRMGSIYCSTGYAQRIADFGTGIRVKPITIFGFGLLDTRPDASWNRFFRNSKIEAHFGIESLDHSKPEPFYIGAEYIFQCHVNIPVLVKPIAWYLLMQNGTLMQDRVDYNLKYDVSTHRIKISRGLEAIQCASSYFYSDFWRNFTFKIHKLEEAARPEIQISEIEYKFALHSENRNIICAATGKPKPEIYFLKDGKRITINVINHINASTLNFPKFEVQHAGVYTCVAKNLLETTKQFTVTVKNDNSTREWTLIVVIPLVVFLLTALGAYIYFKHIRKEKTGLTKQEFCDFMRGITAVEARLTAEGNEYFHEFAVSRPYIKEYEIPPNRFTVDESKVLGKGAYGLVLQGTVDQHSVAVKTIQRNADKQYLKALLSELKIMIHLGQHEHLVPVIGAYTKELRRGFVYVFVKYLPLGNLQTYLRNNTELFDEALPLLEDTNVKEFGVRDMIIWSRDIANGMEYLSSKHVIHGDLAARNILLDENRKIRITDFGLSRQMYDYNDYIKKHQEPLPWRWMSLESLKYMSFSTQSDVWSYGITLYEIFSLGKVPYPGFAWNLDFVDKLEDGLRMGKPQFGPIDVYEIMCVCWNPEPGKRPPFASIKRQLQEILNGAQPSN